MNLSMNLSPCMGMHLSMHMEATPRGIRRKRLWTLDSACHRLILEVCFDPSQMRRAVSRHLGEDHLAADHELYTAALRECQRSGPLALALHRTLDRRYAQLIGQFRSADDATALIRLWRRTKDTDDLAGVLWATLTHPACDTATATAVANDARMRLHSRHAQPEIDDASEPLGAECERLRRALAAMQAELSDARQMHRAEVERLKHVLHDVRAHAADLERAYDHAAQQLHLGPLLKSLRDVRLQGDQVLCVGRHTGADVIHLDEDLDNLEASIAAADAVICQTGCISHNAYWRVKETCTRTGKVCLVVQTPNPSTPQSAPDLLQTAAGPSAPAMMPR